MPPFLNRAGKKIMVTKSYLKNVVKSYLIGFDPMVSIEDLTPVRYQAVKTDREMEHQIGRLMNYRNILTEVKDKHLEGDIVEFGVWQGFSIIWLAYLAEQLKIGDKSFFGFDGFTGLPDSDGQFEKGGFSDTSPFLVRRNIKTSPLTYNKRKIFIFRRMFEDANGILNDMGGRKFSVIHIDCDIASAFESLTIFLPSIMAERCFLLFDDYGCESHLKDSVDRFVARIREQGHMIKVHSATNLTKNFYISKR